MFIFHRRISNGTFYEFVLELSWLNFSLSILIHIKIEISHYRFFLSSFFTGNGNCRDSGVEQSTLCREGPRLECRDPADYAESPVSVAFGNAWLYTSCDRRYAVWSPWSLKRSFSPMTIQYILHARLSLQRFPASQGVRMVNVTVM